MPGVPYLAQNTSISMSERSSLKNLIVLADILADFNKKNLIAVKEKHILFQFLSYTAVAKVSILLCCLKDVLDIEELVPCHNLASKIVIATF